MDSSLTKRLICIILMLSLCMFPLTAYAATYQDDFSNLAESNNSEYNNLFLSGTPVGAWKLFPKGNLLTIREPSNTVGTVTYRVSNATDIKVGVFTNAGTLVSQTEDGSLGLGVQNTSKPIPSGGIQAQYSPKNDIVYTQRNGLYYEARWDFDRFIFYPSNQVPTDSLPYGVFVKVSTNGKDFVTVPLKHLQGEFKERQNFCYEEYRVAIPTGVTHVQVGINGMYAILDANGTRWSANASLQTMLGLVQLSGDSMSMGLVEKPISSSLPESIIPESQLTTSPSSSTASSQTKEKVEKEKKTTGTITTEPSTKEKVSSKEESSRNTPNATDKFVGTAPQASRASSSASRRLTSSKVTSNEVPAREETTMLEDLPLVAPPTQQVYEVEGKTKKDDNFSRIVLGYIIVVSGILLFVLLRPKGKK